MSTTPPRRRRSVGSLALTAAAAVALSGCVTGERPTLTPKIALDDPAVEAVLERLERANSVTFTADYDIVPSTTGATTPATVRRFDDGRLRITIGSIDYIVDGSVSRTCEATDCVDQIDDARISDLNLTHRFWSSSFAARLRIDAARDPGDGEGRIDTIAGRPAACVDLDVVGGTVTYCALDAGGLARYFGADVSIELTSYSASVDPESFEP
jgi:hypothetical protein